MFYKILLLLPESSWDNRKVNSRYCLYFRKENTDESVSLRFVSLIIASYLQQQFWVELEKQEKTGTVFKEDRWEPKDPEILYMSEHTINYVFVFVGLSWGIFFLFGNYWLLVIFLMYYFNESCFTVADINTCGKKKKRNLPFLQFSNYQAWR